jgi:hypothetical protein
VAQRAEDGSLQRGRDVRPEAGHGGRLGVREEAGDDLDDLACKGGGSGQALVGQHTETINVSARIRRGHGSGLLRSHVFRRADHLAREGEPRRGRRGRQRRDAQIDQDRLVGSAVSRHDEDVRRLHVPVHDAPRGERGERPRDLADDGHRLHDGQARPARDEALERAAFDQLERDVRPVLRAMSSVEHGDQVGVPHEPESPGLAQEAIACAPGSAQQVHRLERDPRARVDVLGLEHDAAAPGGDLPDDPITPVNDRARVGALQRAARP